MVRWVDFAALLEEALVEVGADEALDCIVVSQASSDPPPHVALLVVGFADMEDLVLR